MSDKYTSDNTANSTKFKNYTIRPWDVWEYGSLILLITALIGNTLTIIVMRSKRLKFSNTTLFLICLAISDICVLTIKFFINMQKIYKVPVYEFCVLVKILPDMISFTSYWLIITTTIERSIAVSKPFEVSQILTKKKCLFIVFIIIIVSSLVSSTQAFCLKSLSNQPYFCGIKGSLTGPCRYYMNSVYPGIRSAVICWIPSLIAVIFNSFIIKELTKASKQRENIVLTKTFNIRSTDPVQVRPILIRKHINEPDGLNTERGTSDGVIFQEQNEKIIVSTKNKTDFSKRVSYMVPHLLNLTQERQITIMLCTISLTFVVIFTYKCMHIDNC